MSLITVFNKVWTPLGDEVRFLWRKAKTRSTYYFFVNRYLAFFGDVAITVFRFVAVPTSVRRDISSLPLYEPSLTQGIHSGLDNST